jgi:hypothetical protein
MSAVTSTAPLILARTSTIAGKGGRYNLSSTNPYKEKLIDLNRGIVVAMISDSHGLPTICKIVLK